MADPEHHVTRVVASPAFVPEVHLFGQIRCGLASKRRIGRTQAFSPIAVAGGASHEPASGIPLVIKPQPLLRHRRIRLERKGGVKLRHCLALVCAKLPRYPAHLHMVTTAVRIGFQLPFQIAGIQPGEPRRPRAIAASVESVAGKAGVIRSCPRAAQGNNAPGFRKAFKRCCFRSGAGCEQGKSYNWRKDTHPAKTGRLRPLFRLVAFAPMLLPITACKPPPEQSQFMPVADSARGREVIKRIGCGSCHIIPGISWPQGKAGPDLAGLRNRALIAGRLPNRPNILAAYIRNAPALVPGSGMPAMPVSEAEARDVAAYLYQAEDR